MFAIKYWPFFFLLTTLLTINSYGQNQYLPLNKEFEIRHERELNQDSLSHITFKPILVNKSYFASNNLGENKGWLRRKLLYESLIVIDTGDFYLTIDPLFNAEFGDDIANKKTSISQPTYYKNTRGFQLRGNIGKKVGFTSSFYENQAVFVDYLDEYIEQVGVVPGQGRTKVFKAGFDYSIASGVVFYQPNDFLNLQFGNGKHFIGEGYRSIFLSDNSFNYPFFRTSILLFNERLSYDFMFTSFQDLYRLPVTADTEPIFKRKAGNFHYLSWRVLPGFQLGAFESTIFQTVDTNGRNEFEINSINPLFGTNSLTYKLDHKHNSLVGLDAKLDFFDDFIFYSQVAWGDNKFQNYALQVGVKYFIHNNLSLLAEYNQVENGIYATENAFENYAHYGQYLAHPISGGFKEFVGILIYKKNRMFTRMKANYIDYKVDVVDFTTAAYGFGSDILMQELTLGYVVNPINNMNFRVGVLNRNNRANQLNNSTYFFIGFTTSLTNAYYDF